MNVSGIWGGGLHVSQITDLLLLRWFRRETHENFIKTMSSTLQLKTKAGTLDGPLLKIIPTQDR